MKLGWLWLSDLNTTAWPSPMSMTPAFSPGPWITHGALVGNPRRCSLEDLYEQCSFHIAEKIPSSVNVGTRPISLRMRSYSSGLRPWLATSSGVICGWFMGLLKRLRSLIREFGWGGKGLLGGNFPLSIALRAAHASGGFAQPSWIGFKDLIPQMKAISVGRHHQISIPQPPRSARSNRRRVSGLADLAARQF